MQTFKVLVVLGIIGWITIETPILQAQTATKIYLPTEEFIANPGRGWYEDYYSFANYLTGAYRPLDSVKMRTSRENNQITVILRLFYLHQFLNQTSVSADYLAKMQTDFDAVRKAGVKCIVRFAYSDSQNASVYDATPEKVLSHIESLSNVLSNNGDIILAVQAGFIGAWGEWYYTQNFAGAGYVPDATDQANRRAVVEALLQVLPEHIQVQVRTPAIKKDIVESEVPIQDAEAYNGTVKSRVAHHNDCFLANSSDYGTYTNLTADLAYLEQETKYAIAGGETCDASTSYSNCDNAIPRMELLHWTYLNSNYNQDVYDKWETQGCIREVDLKLGYRIYLTEASFTDSVGVGGDVSLSFQFGNVGFAAPTQYKPIRILLKNTETQQLFSLSYTGTNSDIRYWFPGTINTTGTIHLPDTLPNGNYQLSVQFPDQSENLATRSCYSIQLANIGLWDNTLGTNQLNHLLVVGTGGIGELPATPEQLNGTAISETEIKLYWVANNTNETGTEIYYCIADQNNWQLLGETGTNTLEYTATNLQKGTSYSFLVRSTNMYGTSGWSDRVTITTLGVDVPQFSASGFAVYPNPLTKGNVFVFNPENETVLISVINGLGQEIYQTRTDFSRVEIPATPFTNGIYMLKINTKNKTICKKLIVKK